MKSEEHLYPTDILLTKYVTVLEAANRCHTTIPKILEMIKTDKIRSAELPIPNKRSRILHVNYEEVMKELEVERVS